MELQSHLDAVRQAGYGLASILPDPVAVLADFSARRGITFPLLSDEGSATIRRFGLLNTSIGESSEQHGIPHPGTLFLDAQGAVTARFFEQPYQERNTIASLLVRLGADLDRPKARVQAPELEVATFTTDQVASPGTRFSLVLDVVPEEEVRVFAPGASGHRALALKVEPQPGLVMRDAHFPQPEDQLLEPSNVHVPVYRRPFRIVQDVLLDPSKEALPALQALERMTITAVLEYEAGAGRESSGPRSLPLSWTVEVKPLDRERARKP